MLLDTNILVYAINADSPKNSSARTFLQKNTGHLEIAHQNIFEALRVLTHPKFPRPMDPSAAYDALEGIIEHCTVIYPEATTQYLALELVKKHHISGTQIFDAYLAATMLSNNVTTIVTDNGKDFRLFSINVLNPFTR